MIGIIVAMQKELNLLLEVLGKYTITEENGFKFYQGVIDGKAVVCMTCGIGKVNAPSEPSP